MCPGPAEEYSERRLAEVAAALQVRDLSRTAAIVQDVVVDGYPGYADDLLHGVIELSLTEFAARR